jgi:hypothetical protein
MKTYTLTQEELNRIAYTLQHRENATLTGGGTSGGQPAASVRIVSLGGTVDYLFQGDAAEAVLDMWEQWIA